MKHEENLNIDFEVDLLYPSWYTVFASRTFEDEDASKKSSLGGNICEGHGFGRRWRWV